jgi:hypothetical protein
MNEYELDTLELRELKDLFLYERDVNFFSKTQRLLSSLSFFQYLDLVNIVLSDISDQPNLLNLLFKIKINESSKELNDENIFNISNGSFADFDIAYEILGEEISKQFNESERLLKLVLLNKQIIEKYDENIKAVELKLSYLNSFYTNKDYVFNSTIFEGLPKRMSLVEIIECKFSWYKMVSIDTFNQYSLSVMLKTANLLVKKNLSKEFNYFVKNESFFLVSPFLFDLDEWKKRVYINLLSDNNPELIHCNFFEILENLRFILSNKIFKDSYSIQVFNILNYDNGMGSELKKINLNEHFNFLKSIDLNLIKEKRKEIVLHDKLSKQQHIFRPTNQRIILNKSPKKLNSILLEFFRLNEVSLNEDMENRVKRFIKNCFEIKPKYSFESRSNGTINFLDFKLREKLCGLLYVLNEEKIIKYKNSSHVYLTLISDLKDSNNEKIGLSKSTLKPLFSELNDTKNFTQDIIKQTGFKSLRSLRILLSS